MADLDQDGTIFVGKSRKPEVSDARARQSPRPRDRRDRHRQDRDAAGSGGRSFARGRFGLRRRHQGRSLRHFARWARPRRRSSSAPRSLGFDYEPDQFPVVFWDLFGEQGHPIRATDLGDGAAAAVAAHGSQRRAGGRAQHRLPRRRRAGARCSSTSRTCARCSPTSREHAAELTRQYGNVSKPTIGTDPAPAPGAGEPGRQQSSSASRRWRSKDFIRTDRDGRGIINILAADKLMENPRLYATFLLWLLSELFEELPEVGDPDKPKLVLLLRRGASPVQRRAEGAARQDRAGGAADPLEGRRRLFRDAEPARRARQGAGAARQPRAARAARVHAARPEGGEGGGRDVPRQSRSSTPPR